MKKLVTFLLGFLAMAGACFAAPAPITVPTIAALGAGNFSSYDTVQVLGYYAAGDGGGGFFKWSSASTATAEPCITFQTGGLSTGRFIRQLNGASLSILQCGVKADGSTNNTVKLQAAFNAITTYNLGEIYCPASPGVINFASTVTPVAGGVFRGQANTFQPILGSTSNVPGACHLKYTGASGWAFDFQTPFQAIINCPSTVGPSFYNFTLENGSTGSGIRLNNSATAGYSDDCVGSGGGQSTIFNSVFDGVVLSSGQRVTTGIQISKAFDTTITNSAFVFFDTQIEVHGSDNVLINNNKFSVGLVRAVDLVSHGTFGNFNSLRDNAFFSVFTNATDFVRSSARSGVIDSNYFETDFAGITSVLNLTCGLSQTVTNNAMEVVPANVTYWLQMTNDCTGAYLANNYNGAGGQVLSSWNAGSGSHWAANAQKQKIYSFNNPDNNVTTPFVTVEPVPLAISAPTIAGVVLGSFDASSNISGVAGDGLSATWIGPLSHAGDWEFRPHSSGTGGHVTFKMKPAVNATVDSWILAYTGAGSNQQVTCSVGGTSSTFTLTGGTTPTWYSPAALTNLVVTDPTIDCTNADTTRGQYVYITKWQLTKH